LSMLKAEDVLTGGGGIVPPCSMIKAMYRVHPLQG
jgi:hypothetical protein